MHSIKHAPHTNPIITEKRETEEIPPAEKLDTNENLAASANPGVVQPPNNSHVAPAESHDRDTDEYDEGAAKLWSVYVQEAESHDKALIETWKDDMEGIIIFVRSP